MGNCIKGSPRRGRRSRSLARDRSDSCDISVNSGITNSRSTFAGSSIPAFLMSDAGIRFRTRNSNPAPNEVDSHILKTLRILRTSAENDRDLVLQMGDFRSWANSEDGWKMVLNSFIRIVPPNEPLGPSAITLFIDHCPLPTKNAVSTFINELELPVDGDTSKQGNQARHRNICAVLGHLAETLSASFSQLILTDKVLEYILSVLSPTKCVDDTSATSILFSLIALEKLSMTNENKSKIVRSDVKERLQSLEGFACAKDCKKRQVGFLAQWLLDNVFVIEGRPYTYETVDITRVNVMLNDNDVSEYLKISPDGLEARSDAPSFESVRCTYCVDEGIWYYEVTIITPGVMQIGWATKNSKFLNHDGFGIGDDEYSYAYDGCRQLCWYQARSTKHSHQVWQEGDILGLLLDIDHREVVFYLNGEALPPEKGLFNYATSGFFAAASFMSFQQCRFNFGSEPFKYPPKEKEFSTFNDVASLDEKDKTILPKHKKLEALRRMSVREDGCTICYDTRADTTLEPCGHSGICQNCAYQLTQCHLCRKLIMDRKVTS